MQTDATWHDKVKACLFYPLPHHLISRLIFRLTRIESLRVQPFIRWFIKRYRVDMSEAADPRPESYGSFNKFFTRALKPGLRTFPGDNNILACPVDGAISQIGRIEQGGIFQAKGHSFSALELLGGDPALAKKFDGGRFATLYLSPRDYHRIHMPLTGELKEMIYIPGRLFSVSPSTTRAVPRLFARNERVAAIFEGDAGPFAMVLVGAINVAAIETVWHGLVTPPQGKRISRYAYRDKPVNLKQGQEMGRFNMGSTVILLTDTHFQWLPELGADMPVQLGQPLAAIDG